jgi:leucyl aminopeptidase
VDCVIVGIYERGKFGDAAIDIDAASKGALKRLLKGGDISGQLGQCRVLTDVGGVRATRVAVVGLGKVSEFGVTQFSKALAAALHAISKTKCRQILNGLTLESVAGTDMYYLARHSAQAVGESMYRFTRMKSGRSTPAMPLKFAGQRLHTQLPGTNSPEARQKLQELANPDPERD